MSEKIKIHAPEVLITPGDTVWAIAAKVPPSALEDVRRRLIDYDLPYPEGSKVVSGKDGMCALLVFGGGASQGEEIASKLSRKYRTPAYLLDFDDELEFEEGMGIRQFEGKRYTWVNGHPAAFLDSHGIDAPGYEPGPESPVITIGVIEDTTLDQVYDALPGIGMPGVEHFFAENARGVLVKDPIVTHRLADALERDFFTIFYDREDKSFSCHIWKPGSKEACFAIGQSPQGYEVADSVLGETTLEGILRVLDIPRELLFPDPAAGGAESDERASASPGRGSLVAAADRPDEDDELGFEDVDMAIRKLGEKMLKRVNGHTVTAHDSREIDAPRYKSPSDPLTCIGVVEG